MPPEAVQRKARKIWIARVLVAIVIFINLQAAVQYLLDPNAYSSAFELEGIPGMAAVMGVGILYVMWQVPYIFAAINPVAYRLSLTEAVLMQAIGLLGETWLRSRIPVEHIVLRNNILRYIFFDAGGLVLLVVAWTLVNKKVIDQKKAKDSC
jgi:hypothetical protein